MKLKSHSKFSKVIAIAASLSMLAVAPLQSSQAQMKRDANAIKQGPYQEQGQFNFRRSGGYHVIRSRRKSGGWMPRIKHKHFNKKRHGKALRRKHRRAAA